MCMYMYMSVCVCMCMCMYMCVYRCIYLDKHKICVYICLFCILTLIYCICKNTYIHTYSCTYTYTYTHTYILYTYKNYLCSVCCATPCRISQQSLERQYLPVGADVVNRTSTKNSLLGGKCPESMQTHADTRIVSRVFVVALRPRPTPKPR